MKKVIVREIPQSTEKLHQHPLLHKIYAARGVTNPSELDYDFKRLLSYKLLKDIERGVECLFNVLENQQHVLILGDFDADGATSTTLAILALKAFGLENVSYLIPNRFEYGYGLTPEIVEVAAGRKPDIILTVDNGIASIEGVKAANELGIKVLVTDHHLPGDDIPNAYAIINPNQKDDNFPSKNLAGVGVIFYLMLALRTYLREKEWFVLQNIPEPNMAQFLDLVALGTVADSVVLDHNNRILVSQGINRIRNEKSSLGIKTLLALANRNCKKTSVYDLGFMIAPRLNAAGRLDDMALGVECLLTNDPVEARKIVRQLESLNNERRGIAEDMQKQALRALNNLQLNEELPPGLCVFDDSWHQGVLGILASRLKDKLHRPVAVFTAISDDEIKGSARSVAGVHIRDVLDNIVTKNPGLITRFGGHAMAAGLSLPRENFETFSQVFAKEVAKHLTVEELKGIIYTDGELPAEYFNIDTAELLGAAGPWGAGFSEPLFFGEFALSGQNLVGKKHLKLTLQHLESKQEVSAICFNVDTAIWSNPRYSKAKIVYRLDINEYNSKRNLQLIVHEIIHYE